MLSHVNNPSTTSTTRASAAVRRAFSTRPVVSMSTPSTYKGILRYSTHRYGKHLKRGLRNKIPPIRRYSQLPRPDLNSSTNDGGFSGGLNNHTRHQFIKYFALFSIGFIFYGVSSKLYRQSIKKGGEDENGDDFKVKPSHSWSFFCYSTLPLNAISRLWGQLNSIDLPVWLREPGYKFYAYCFGANLDEIKEKDLTKFKNLSQFFYRELQPGARVIDPNADIVCPSDGRVLQFGVIENGDIEQVKGMTYSIDAFLGDASNTKLAAPRHPVNFDNDEKIAGKDENFAEINGISYTLDDVIGGEGKNVQHLRKIIYKEEGDRALKADSNDVGKVVTELTKGVPEGFRNDKELYYAVIYLAPGDYHRYHSPTDWVVTLRRHFIGELFSVAPYFQRTLQNLFVLNERVALLGYWKYGFFSMTPVGATNVGSIKINFDKDLTTNTKYENPHYKDSQLQEQLTRVKKYTCYEATYSQASKILGGFPVTKGEEVGGFMLGSTVVLVFEAPKNFQFKICQDQKVKMGQVLGTVVE